MGSRYRFGESVSFTNELHGKPPGQGKVFSTEKLFYS
jgi:hypothetical protein